MTPVDQSIFEDGKGDCLRACVASILDLPLADVPNFAADDSYLHGAIKFCAERGLKCLRIDFSGEGYDHSEYICCPGVRCILGGWSPRGKQADGSHDRKQHAVVGMANGWNFEVVHDPHPSRDGLIGEPTFAMWIFRDATL